MASAEARPPIPPDSLVVMTTAVVPPDKKDQFSQQAEKILRQLGAASGLLQHDVHLDEGPDASVRVHTVTVWETTTHMLDFVRTGAHREAVQRAGEFVLPDTFKSQNVFGADVGGVLPTKETVIAAFQKGSQASSGPQVPQQRVGGQ